MKRKKTVLDKIIIFILCISIFFTVYSLIAPSLEEPFPRVFTEWSLPTKELGSGIIETTEGNKEIIDFYQDNNDNMYVKLKDNRICKYDFATLSLSNTEYKYLYQIEIAPYDFEFDDAEIKEERNISINTRELELTKSPKTNKVKITNNDAVLYEFESLFLEEKENVFRFVYNIETNRIAVLFDEITESQVIIDLEENKEVSNLNDYVFFNDNGQYISTTTNLYKWNGSNYEEITVLEDKVSYRFYDDYILMRQRVTPSIFNNSKHREITIYKDEKEIITKSGSFLGIVNNVYYKVLPSIYGKGYVVYEYDIITNKIKAYTLKVLDSENKEKIIEQMDGMVKGQYVNRIVIDEINSKMYLGRMNEVIVVKLE